jgi:hypothetical protein
MWGAFYPQNERCQHQIAKKYSVLLKIVQFVAILHLNSQNKGFCHSAL